MPSRRILTDALDRTIGFVTAHNLLVLVVMVALTAGMATGISQLDTGSEAGGVDDIESVEIQKAEYITEYYVNRTEDEDDPMENVSRATVYVRDPDGNVLSRSALLESLRFQQEVTSNESVADALVDAGQGQYVGVPNIVAMQVAGDPTADLDAQIDALESATDDAVASVVSATFTDGSPTLRLLPTSYEPGTASATSHRMTFFLVSNGTVAGGESGQTGAGNATNETAAVEPTRVIYEATLDRNDPEYFTLGVHALQDANMQYFQDTVELILPAALLLILGVLAFTYRDLVDVIVGMTGVVVSILWMFGILGWLGVSAGVTMIVGPVLIAGLSIDFGFHVFNRYREQRGPDEGRKAPMTRAVRSLVVALALVTITAGIGFLSNVVNPLPSIRNLGIGITLGVVSALIVFVTLVPAMKLTIDGVLEWIGLNRRKAPLGQGRGLSRILGGSVWLATRAAPVVLVLALVAGAAGATAWNDLDRESFQQQSEPAAEWKKNLPEPMAWEDPEFYVHAYIVQQEYRAQGDSQVDFSQLLVEGEVTADGMLDRIERGIQRAHDRGIVFEQPGVSTVRSPVTVIQSVAARNASFASTLQAADVDGDDVPDRNLTGVYDHLYAVAPNESATVIERTDGEYRSLRVVLPVDRTAGFDQRADDVQAAAAAIEGEGNLTATAVGQATIGQSVLAALTDGILETLVIALLVMAVTLMAIYRIAHGSATLGFVTVVPIALVVGLVVAGMVLLDVPLTLLTALLMSLVIGLGVDYNIHISDRFVQEFGRTGEAMAALQAAVTGTGGALLGSTLTSAGAFATLALHPNPQMQSFGTMVVLALVTSFLVSVFILPSLIVLWSRYGPSGTLAGKRERNGESEETEPAVGD